MARNDEVADRLEEFADLLEAQDVDYKPRAYRDAADNVRDHPAAIEGLVAEGQDAVADIEGVGDAISSKIVEYIETDTIDELEELRSELPVEMDALTRIEGVGPKTVKKLYDGLGVQTLDDLEAAAEAGEIQELSGFGPKTEENIRGGIDFARESHERQLLSRALPRADRVSDFFDGVEAATRHEIAGSLRRRRPTIGDIDVLVSTDDSEAVIEAFTGWEGADGVIEAGTGKASIRLGEVNVDLRVVDPDEFGAALQYFTGSKDHNITLRNLAIDTDRKVNEYGIFEISEVADPDAGQRVGERLGGAEEAEIYEILDLDWIPPELREDRGEISAAKAGTLPNLVSTDAIRGDLHVHSDWSDGAAAVEDMVEAAAEYGHEYVAITDHATGPGMVGGVGVTDDELLELAEVVDAVAADADIEVFTGVEANIDSDGGLSVDDDVLAELDVVVASPHSDLAGDATDRLVTAAEHPEVTLLGHPTGRQLNKREAMSLDVEHLATVASDAETALEINAHPRRLDLRGSAVKTAIEAGATIAVNTDAHDTTSYDHVEYGVDTARRGWAEASDILNTMASSELVEFLA